MLSSRGQSCILHTADSNTIQCVVQIKLLRVLGHLGTSDKQASDNMYSVVAESMRRGNTGHTIGNAIVYEAVRTIASIYPNPALLQSGESNLMPALQCRGIYCLCSIGTIPCIGCVVKHFLVKHLPVWRRLKCWATLATRQQQQLYWYYRKSCANSMPGLQLLR